MMRQELVLGWAVAVSLLPMTMSAQGTKLWTVDRYAAMARGPLDGVAVRNDGRLESGPSKVLVNDTGKSYIWSLRSAMAGNAYVGLGGSTAGSATVLRVASDG